MSEANKQPESVSGPIDGSTRSCEELRQQIKQEWADAVEADDPDTLDDWPVDRIVDLEQTFDLRWQADMRGIKKWQETTGEELTWPDHADLVVYLVRRLKAAEDVIDVARQQGRIKINSGPHRQLSEFEQSALHTALHIKAYDREFNDS